MKNHFIDIHQTHRGEDLAQQIQAAQQRFNVIYARTEQEPDLTNGLLGEAVAEIATNLEELRVAVEEIQKQNESLFDAQQLLVRERERYQELFELAPDAYLVTSPTGIIQEANQAASRLLQRQQKYLIGKPINVFVPEQGRSAFRQKLNQIQNLPTLHDWEMDIQIRQGDIFTCAITVSTALDEYKQLKGFRWLFRDITRQKLAEAELRRVLGQEQELNQWKSRIIHTIAHEYRAPLNVIALATSVLKDFNRGISEDQKLNFLQKIQANVSHLINLVDDMLTHSQMGSSSFRFSPAVIDLEQFCQETIETFQLTLDDSHNLCLEVSGNCKSACMDARLLKQILNNLLSNAIKYSPEGGDVHLTLECQEKFVTIQVQDQGIGIHPDDCSKLFEPFFRGSNISTIPGNGIGLAIVKKAVDLHGGQIGIESTSEEGTRFKVRLPMQVFA